MNTDLISKTFNKYFGRKMANYILGKRVCPKCAKKAWKDEDKSQSFTQMAGICENCHKAGIVAYIEK